MKRIDRFKGPLGEALLKSANFFELYPFDGGGCFVMYDQLGSFDDFEIADAILKRQVMAEFGTLPGLDFRKFERWSTIEKTAWLNRLYFLAPLARVAALQQDDAIAALVKDVILYFHRNYPPPQGKDAVCELSRRVLASRDRDYNQKSAAEDGRTEYQWFDFQPASRIVNTVNAMLFLRHSPVISEAEWREFDDFVRAHAETIYLDEKYNSKLAPGNHQALRGLALLYGAAYFDGEECAARWAEEGERLCSFHMHHDYLADGTLIDISPSYHVFETWIGRDAAKLAANYRFKLTPEALETLHRAYKVCRQLCQPDGNSVVIDDGYSLNMDVFLSSFGPAFRAEERPEFVLPASKMAFHRDEKYFAILDASPSIGKYSHYHGGKNAVTLWFDGQPFCVDSGCCNYDDPDFAAWFKQPQAHSTLLVDGQGESLLSGRYDWQYLPEISLGEWNAGSIEAELTSGAPCWNGAAWRRRLTIGDGIEISDRVSLPEARQLEFIFNLHPGVEVEIMPAAIRLNNRGASVELTWEANAEIRWALQPGMVYENFRKHPSKRLTASAQTAGLRFRTLWRIR